MPTSNLMLAFLNWRMRFVPARPRRISAWSGGISPFRFRELLPTIKPLLDDVEAGTDLTPRLSKAAWTKGIVLPGAGEGERGKDMDATLIRLGLHHFHVGERRPDNPKGRSDTLVFAHVMETEFRIISVSSHSAFDVGSAEQQIFTQYATREVPPGQGFMLNPVMSSGHSMIMRVFADHCDHQMMAIDPSIDKLETADTLYACQLPSETEPVIRKPARPSFSWAFHDLKFGLIDRKTDVFFSMWSLLDR